MTTTPRLLVLVDKGLTSVQVAAQLDEVQQALVRFGIQASKLKDSAAWYREKFSSCGDWDSWIWETVCGRDYATRAFNFDGYVVTKKQLGRANASILSLALRNQRAVLSWQEGEPIQVVRNVLVVDENNWTEGWTFETAEVGG